MQPHMVSSLRIDASKKRRIPRQLPPNQLERSYTRLLQRWLGDAINSAYKDLVDALPILLPDGKKDAKVDASPTLESMLAMARKRMKAALDLDRFKKFLGGYSDKVEAWSKKEFDKQTRAAFGVDLLTNNPQFEQRAKEFISTNVDLITTLSDNTCSRIEKVMFSAAQDGRVYTSVAKELVEAEGIELRHAKLIARDQTGKLYGQLNADRQQAAGLTDFIWRTSQDQAVRDMHAALEGQRFRFDDPPDVGLPGEDYQCRCHAEPVFDTLLV